MKKLYKGLIRLFMLMVWLMLLFESVMYLPEPYNFWVFVGSLFVCTLMMPIFLKRPSSYDALYESWSNEY
jgi:uncharacterized protein YhhL (DUF1145 family)